MGTRALIDWALVVSALALAATASAASATAVRTDPKVVLSPRVSIVKQKAAISYWTPARMAAATPPTLKHTKPGGVHSVIAGNTARGRPGIAGGMPPGGLHASLNPESEQSIDNTSTPSTGSTSTGLA